MSLCADPSDPNRLYVGDGMSVRSIDVSGAGAVKLLAGSAKTGFADGFGSAARFYYARGILCSPDGRTLFVADHDNCRIRAVDTRTGAVTTVAGGGGGGGPA